jgi:alpha-glucosidase
MRSATPLESVRVTRFGDPITTGAFANDPATWTWASDSTFAYETVSSGDGMSITVPLLPADSVVGLGQHVGPVNCRGQIFRLFSTDTFQHIPSARAMYGVYPLLMVLGKNPRMFFLDSPAEVKVDAGSTHRDILQFHSTSPDFHFIEIVGASVAEIFARYLTLTGTPYIPPRWAFGYQQSRWSYKSEAEVLAVAENMAKHKIPCDVIHVDIHYMKDYRVFTFDEERFPDLPALSRRLLEQGIRLISIIDPGVKAEAGYSIYDEGHANGYFCQRADGKGDFVGAVWPGPSVFPDFFREDVRNWWGSKYQALFERGFSGFWNDMNEPSIFYTPEAFHDFADRLQELRRKGEYGEELANTLFDKGVCLKEGYYDEFVHQVEGRTLPHRSVHNIFGTMMTRSVAEHLQDKQPNRRHFVLSRSSYPGMHRYAAIWTGDNHSWWEHLALNIQMMVSLNISGMLYTGADVGGFSGDCNGELLVRWTQLGAFAPFFRNHAALWAKHQEPWSFDQETLELCTRAIRLRYAILPYYYAEFVHAALQHQPFIRGLFYDFDEAWSRLNDNQFCVGAALLVAPVIEAAVSGRMVWLPGTSWLKLALASEGDGFVGERVLPAGDHYIEAGLAEIPTFLRYGQMLAMSDVQQNAMAPAPHHYRLLAFTDSEASARIVLDSGEERLNGWQQVPKAVCTLKKVAGAWQLSVDFESAAKIKMSFEVEVWSSSGNCEVLKF